MPTSIPAGMWSITVEPAPRRAITLLPQRETRPCVHEPPAPKTLANRAGRTAGFIRSTTAAMPATESPARSNRTSVPGPAGTLVRDDTHTAACPGRQRPARPRHRLARGRARPRWANVPMGRVAVVDSTWGRLSAKRTSAPESSIQSAKHGGQPRTATRSGVLARHHQTTSPPARPQQASGPASGPCFDQGHVAFRGRRSRTTTPQGPRRNGEPSCLAGQSW